MLYSKEKKSFTLIELLVVIAIIGLLASVVLVSMQGVRGKARDTRRKQDLSTIQTALELYWQKYERYPGESMGWDLSIGSVPANPQNYWDANSDLQVLVTEALIGRIPIDPTNNATYYYSFEPDSDGQGPPAKPACILNSCRYVLCANRLEETGAIFCLDSAEQGP